MNIAIRADASNVIGAGHIMRCLTLANSLKNKGASVTFLCRQYQGNLIAKITQQGFPVLKLSTLKQQSCNSDVSYSQEQDIQECTEVLKDSKIFDLFIVDHYELDSHWHTALKPYYTKLLVIDDLANRKHHCDFLLDQTLNRSQKSYGEFIPLHCQTLLGQPYMLLREEFSNKKSNLLNKRLNKKELNHVLITMGGMDPHNLSLIALNSQVLLKEKHSNLKVSVLITSQATHIKQLKVFADKHQWIDLKIDSSNVSEIMEKADIAIGASGSTAWERCCLALPTLSIIDATNQIFVDQSLTNQKACISLGWYENITSELLYNQCRALLEDRETYNKLAISANDICDGKGSERVSQILLDALNNQTIITSKSIIDDTEKGSGLTLTLATKKDCEQVYQWQTTPSLRQYFNEPKIPTFDEHTLWFKNTLVDKNRQLYIICNDNVAVGTVRLDKLKGNKHEISILISPKEQGNGYGLLTLKALPQIINNTTIIANVHKKNKYSHKLFISAGFYVLSPTSYALSIEDNEIKYP